VREETEEDLVLPPFDLAVLDEAHQAADIARDFFGFRITAGAARAPIRLLGTAGHEGLAARLDAEAGRYFDELLAHRRSPEYRTRLRAPEPVPWTPLCDTLGDVAAACEAAAEAAQDAEEHAALARAGRRAGGIAAARAEARASPPRIPASCRGGDSHFTVPLRGGMLARTHTEGCMRSFVTGWALCLLLALGGAGCGDDVNAPAGRVIARGGVGDGAIKGALNVVVIDSNSGRGIAGAQVRVGSAAEAAPLEGATDSGGFTAFRNSKLSGAQTVTATAAGYTAATWIGVNGANVTIPLTPSPAPLPSQAQVGGTIAGWDARPAPAQGHMLLAFVATSAIEPLDGPANHIAQDTVTIPNTQIELPTNLCAKVATYSKCDYKLKTRSGKQIRYAMVVDVDTHGTPADRSDDTYTLVDYAFQFDLDVTGGTTTTGESLTPIGQSALVTLGATFAAAPAGLAHVGAVPVIDMGEGGKLVLAVPGLTPAAPSMPVPPLAGGLASGKYQVVATATAAGGALPMSTIVTRSVAPGSTVDLGAWMTPPTALAASGGAWSFTAAPGASVHMVGLFDGAGTPLWGVALLDGSTSFTLPALSPSPLPAGAVDMRVEALQAPGFDPADFSVDALTAAVTHLAADRAQVTP
jgi:hypothetical protein